MIPSPKPSDSDIRPMRSSTANWDLQADAPHPLLLLNSAYDYPRIIPDRSERVGPMGGRNSCIEFPAASVLASSFPRVGRQKARQSNAWTRPS